MKLTPKEKAKNIYNQMLEWVTDAHIYKERNVTSITAKKCSLICVNELEDLQFEMYGQDKEFTMYFLEVRKELQAI